jgi:hypothetical protein
MATLIGVARALPETCTFVVPVFVDRLGRKLAQRVDEAGTVINFELMETPAEFQPVRSSIDVLPGDPALFAFEITPETFLVGTGRELAEMLTREAATATLRDATRRAVRRFVETMLSTPPSSSAGVLIQFSSGKSSVGSARSPRGQRAAGLSTTDWTLAASVALALIFILTGRPKDSEENIDQPAVSELQPGVGIERSDGSVATEENENRVERLSDGSLVSLSSGSRMQFDFSAQRRIVSLQRGKAQFTVAKDPGRPFVVSTSLADVTALGTRFTVAVDTGLVVDVYEGAVQISAPRGTSASGVVTTLRSGERFTLPGIGRDE